MNRGISHLVAGLVIALTLPACGGGGTTNPPGPSPVVKSAVVTGTLTMSARYDGTAANYTGSIRLGESGGVGVTLGTARFTYFRDGSALATLSWTADEAWLGGTKLTANGTLISYDLIAVQEEPDLRPNIAEVAVSYTDDNQHAGTVTLRANVPELGDRPRGTLTLSGTVKSGSSLLGDVLIEVRSGQNAGRSVRTGSNGRYSLTELLADTMTVRASKAGYSNSQTSVSLTGNRTQNFELARALSAGGSGDDQALRCGSGGPSTAECSNDAHEPAQRWRRGVH